MKKNIFKLSALFLSLFTVSCSISVPNIDISQYVSVTNTNSNLITPDGKSKTKLNFQFKDNQGNLLVNKKVNFSISPISPIKGFRDANEISPVYSPNSQKFLDKVSSGEIKLLGIIEPKECITDSNAECEINYTSSNIGGNEEDPAKEKIIAQGDNIYMEKEIQSGYSNLEKIPEIEGLLRISGARGRYAHKNINKLLENISSLIQKLEWKQPITITAGNLKWGGLYPPHFTHRYGEALDIRPMSSDGQSTWCNTDGNSAKNYDREKTLELIKFLNQSGASEIYFNDPQAVKFGAKPLAGHHNHIHVSWNNLNPNIGL